MQFTLLLFEIYERQFGALKNRGFFLVKQNWIYILDLPLYHYVNLAKFPVCILTVEWD